MKRFLVLLFMPLLAMGEEIQFAADTTSGNGQVVPVLTWSTVPAADSCVASGGWSGEKGASGSETLPAIQTSATYNLTCTWAGSDDVTLTWTNPTHNTDGSPYTDPDFTRVEYSQDGQDPWASQTADHPATSFVIEDLAAGDWFFRAFAVNALGVSSEPSGIAVKEVDPQVSVQDSIGITVNPKPNPPTNLTAE